ncbi:MAG TPA: hypothetical protein DDW50_11020 [Firmicutes bacterium]|jgi:deoxyribonucleoside regulator|nr:hypothetical protein [Bacillota bacterium]
MDFLVQVVHLYYQRNMTQDEIAKRLGVSKMTVSRALKTAETQKLVEIKINLPIMNHQELEKRLIQRLNLNEVFVTCPPVLQTKADRLKGELLLDFIGKSTALFIDHLLQDSITIGIAQGKTIGYIARNLSAKKLNNAKVVQILGGLNTSSSYNPYDLLQLVSSKLGAEGTYMSGQAFVINEMAQKVIMAENLHSGIGNLWAKCDFCLAALGSCSNNGAYVTSGLLNDDDLQEVVQRGAVGDIVGHFYNQDGNFVTSILHKRVNSIPIEDLRKVKQIIVTASGSEKIKPIIGAARTGLPITLITDQHTAEGILEELGGK